MVAVLVPARDGLGRRQAEAGLGAVPGHRSRHRGAAGCPGGRRAARADPAPGLRGRCSSLGMLEELGVAGVIDEVTGPRRADAGASAGTYLVLAALNRLVAP